MPTCKNCGIDLDGEYIHWSISGFPYCSICFELMLVVTSNRWLRDCQRAYAEEMRKRQAMLRGL